MGWLGLNTPGRGQVPGSNLVAMGARAERYVAYPDYAAAPRIIGQYEQGIITYLVLASEWLTDDEAEWPGRFQDFADRYASLASKTAYSGESPLRVIVGNEPASNLGADLNQDGTVTLDERQQASPSSWVMEPNRFSRLLVMARQYMPDAYLVSGGDDSGQSWWLGQCRLDVVDAIGLHLYAKHPWTSELANCIQGYTVYGLPLIVDEYHSHEYGLTQYFRDDPRISGALAFCFGCGVSGFEIGDDETFFYDFTSASGGQAKYSRDPYSPLEAWNEPNPQPGGAMPEFQQGIRAEAERLASIGVDVGEPLEDEQPIHAVPGGDEIAAYQTTTRGEFKYSRAANTTHFYRAEGT